MVSSEKGKGREEKELPKGLLRQVGVSSEKSRRIGFYDQLLSVFVRRDFQFVLTEHAGFFNTYLGVIDFSKPIIPRQ